MIYLTIFSIFSEVSFEEEILPWILNKLGKVVTAKVLGSFLTKCQPWAVESDMEEIAYDMLNGESEGSGQDIVKMFQDEWTASGDALLPLFENAGFHSRCEVYHSD